jgi:hypothetical protein
MKVQTRKPSLEGLKKAEASLHSLYSKQPSEELVTTISQSFGSANQSDFISRIFSKLKTFVVLFIK